MPARVPLDVDLEDKLVYGLTPMRMAYLALALLAGFAVWSSAWAPAPLRAVVALFVIGTGAILGWGSWRGRPADLWVIDISVFLVRTHEVRWNGSRLRLLQRWRPGGPLSVASPDSFTTAG